MTIYNEKLSRSNLLKVCYERYEVNKSNTNGLLKIIDKRSKEVVKKVKTYKKAVKWVLDTVKEDLKKEETVSE